MYGSIAAALTRRYDEEQHLKAYTADAIQDVHVHALVGCVPMIHADFLPITSHRAFLSAVRMFFR